MPTSSQLIPTPGHPVQKTSPRILVLGSEQQLSRVKAYQWSDLPEQLNVGDFDVIVLNLASFLAQQTERGIRPERLPPWQQLARLLFSQGSEIICIGLPGIEGNSLYQSTTWWLPVTPEVVLTSGESIQDVKSEFAYYFKHVQRWFFYANRSFKAHFLGLPRYLQLIHPHAKHLQVGMGAIARNRLQQTIAFKMGFRVSCVDPRRSLPNRSGQPANSSALIDSGTVIWLPPPTDISVDEAIHLVLTHRYSISTSQIVPNWANAYLLPQQRELEAQKQKHQQAIAQLTQELEQIQQQLTSVSSLNRLLYEANQDTLAMLVGRALQQLGAQVQAIPCPGRDAMGVISPSGQTATVLVRVKPKTIGAADLRQLERWLQSLRSKRNWQGKGILIANANVAQPPAQRKQVFPDNCVLIAQASDYCLITTVQLFQAIALQESQQLTTTQFWDLVLATNGALSLKEHGKFLESSPSLL